jgi:hypothetical protein
VSAALGLDPTSLLELDGPMFAALERAVESRWTAHDELQALTLELAHAHFVAFLGAHTKPGTRLPTPMRVPRPTADGFERPPVLTPAAFAAEYGPTRSSDA